MPNIIYIYYLNPV